MEFGIGPRTAWALGLLVAFAAGCAEQSFRELRTRPVPEAVQGAGASAGQRKVVLFRVVVDADGKPLEGPWTRHISGLGLYTVVGAPTARPSTLKSFEPGWTDTQSSENGWAFLALTPGPYQLTFEGTAMRFAMPGSRYVGSDSTVGIGQSAPVSFVVPDEAGLFYIGTFTFTCDNVMNAAENVRLECTRLEIRKEAEQAQRVAQRALSEYGPVKELPAVPAELQRSR